MFSRIVKIDALDGHRVRLKFEDGVSGEADFAKLIDQGGVFAELANTEVFRCVQIGENGRYIEWPRGIDFCADALRKRSTRPCARLKFDDIPACRFDSKIAGIESHRSFGGYPFGHRRPLFWRDELDIIAANRDRIVALAHGHVA